MDNYKTGLESSFARAALPEAKGSADVVLSEVRHQTITQLSCFIDEFTKFEDYLKSHGWSGLPQLSCAEQSGDGLIARVEAEKIWVISASKTSDFDASYYPLDLSSARAILRLSGPRASDVMARLCAVDFRDKSRQFHATGIHHVPVHIHAKEGVFDIYMPRSFAESLTDYIINISRQFQVQMAI